MFSKNIEKSVLEHNLYGGPEYHMSAIGWAIDQSQLSSSN